MMPINILMMLRRMLLLIANNYYTERNETIVFGAFVIMLQKLFNMFLK